VVGVKSVKALMTKTPNDNSKNKNTSNGLATTVVAIIVVVLFVGLILPAPISLLPIPQFPGGFITISIFIWGFALIAGILLVLANGLSKQNDFTSNVGNGSENLTKILNSFGKIVSTLNNLFRWQKLKDIVSFSLFFGIIANLFLPQILDFGFGAFKPFSWLKYDDSKQPLIFSLKNFYDREIFLEMVKNGTINTLITYSFWTVVVFVGGNKVLSLMINGGLNSFLDRSPKSK
jgi:hypothetical protein